MMVPFSLTRRRASLAGAVLLVLAAGCGNDEVIDPAPPASGPAVFVVNSVGETLSRYLIESAEVAANALAIGAVPNDLAIGPDGVTGYAVCSRDNRVDVVDLDGLTVLDSIDLGRDANPYAIALAGASDAYVSNFLLSEVAHLDLAAGTVERRIAVGPGPEGVLFVPDAGARGASAPAGDLFVAITRYRPDWAEVGEIAVVSVPADTVRAHIAVGINPQSIALAPDGLLHVVCTGDDARDGKIFVVDPARVAVVDSVTIGGSPVAALPLAAGSGLTVGYGGGLRRYDVALSLSVEARALRGAGSLTALAYDASDDLLYVADGDADSVYIVALAADTLASAFACGDYPVDLVVRR